MLNKMKERAYYYFVEQNMNCAESVFLSANDAYEMGLDPKMAKMIGGFGGGIGCGNVCGALAGCVAVIGQQLIEVDAHKTEGFKEDCAKLVSMFEQKLGSSSCEKLTPIYKKEDGTRCIAVVHAACEVLYDFLREKKGEAAEPVTAEQKAAVKAQGFLFDKTTPDCFNARVITVNGKITTEQAIAIAEAAKLFGKGEVAMTSRQTIEVQGVPYKNIPAFVDYLAQRGLETGGTGPLVRPVVSCKGTTCQYGNIDTFAISEEIHQRFYKGYRGVKLPHKFKIAVGGCPNNCVKPDINDLGIVGQRVPNVDLDKCRGCGKCQVVDGCPIKSAALVDGKINLGAECNNCGRCVGKCPFGVTDESTVGYRVYIGGRWGKKVARGIPLTPVITDKEELMAIVEKAILLFRDKGITGERFNDTINRIGFEEAQRLLLSNELLERRDEIIGGEKHAKVVATC